MAAPPWSLSVAQTVALIEEKLAAAGYDHTVDRAALHAGTPMACTQILRFLFVRFSPRLNAHLVAHGHIVDPRMNDVALATAVLSAWPALSAQPKLGAMTATRFADLAPPSERLLFTLQAILACIARDRELASPPGSLGAALHSDGQLPFTNRIGSASASAADQGPLLVSTWPASARSSDMSWSSSSMTSTGRISFSDDGSAPPLSLGPQDGGDGTSTLQRMLDAYREQLQPDDDDDAGAEPAAATATAGASSDGAAQQAAWEARFAAAADDDDGPPAVHFDDDDQRRYAEQLRGLGLLHVLTPDDSETGCADADGEIRRQFADAIAGVDFGPRDALLEDSFDDERFNTPFVASPKRSPR